MASFEEFKKKAAERIGVLNADILAEKDNIRKASLEIGKLYYEYFKADPHEPMKELCEKIAAANAAIEAKKAEIERLKADDPEAAAEAETVEAETEEAPEEDDPSSEA